VFTLLDRFLIKSFIKPFIVTFFVMELFLLMQFVWKYIDDLVGRGVEWFYIIKLLFYFSAGVFPLALPISILLSSIMTFGSLGENYELAALKSGGISLVRAMRPLILFVFLVSIGAFYFTNYVIPVANFKGHNLLINISKQKPTLNIRQGVFYSEIPGFTIKVAKKYGENQNLLEDVIIYDRTGDKSNTKVITAKKGEMNISPDELWLYFNLYDGYSYEEMPTNQRKERLKRPFLKSSFTETQIKFSLSDFQQGNLNEENRRDYSMLNTGQLLEAKDTLDVDLRVFMTTQANRTLDKFHYRKVNIDSLAYPHMTLDTTILANIPKNLKFRVIENALRNARSNRQHFDFMDDAGHWKEKQIARHVLEWHKKFSLSFSCLILFFIGAPFGAIIRKGGMGLPVVVSVIIFIVFHVLTISFEKLGRELVWEPGFSVWASSGILLPIGFFLTYKAANDSNLFNAEAYSILLKKVKSLWRIIIFWKK